MLNDHDEKVTPSVSISVQKNLDVKYIFMVRTTASPSAIIASGEVPTDQAGDTDARAIIKWMHTFLPGYTCDAVLRLLKEEG